MSTIEPHYVRIPHELRTEDVREVLTAGHGYNWIILSTKSEEVHYGFPRRSEMPELRMVGRWVILEHEHMRYSDLIERILRVLSSTHGGLLHG